MKQQFLLSFFLLIFLVLSCTEGKEGDSDFNQKTNDSSTQTGQIVLIIKDSIPLRDSASNNIDPVKYLKAGIQLKILDTLKQNSWYKVKIGEFKGYQLSHNENYWIKSSDIFEKTNNNKLNIEIDLSLFETGKLNKCRKVKQYDYINSQKNYALDSNFYIGSSYFDNYEESTNKVGNHGKIYKPQTYIIFSGDESNTDAESFEELEARYRALYEKDSIKIFYRLNSSKKIVNIQEKLISSKLIMDSPGCYPGKYIKTTVNKHINKVLHVNDTSFISISKISTDFIFNNNSNGGVQNTTFVYILNVEYDDKTTELIAKRLKIWWPMCL